MGDSKEFAEGVFNALARRKGINPEDGINKEELQSFWEEMTGQDLDIRLQIFFDMYGIHVPIPSNVLTRNYPLNFFLFLKFSGVTRMGMVSYQRKR